MPSSGDLSLLFTLNAEQIQGMTERFNSYKTGASDLMKAMEKLQAEMTASWAEMSKSATNFADDGLGNVIRKVERLHILFKDLDMNVLQHFSRVSPKDFESSVAAAQKVAASATKHTQQTPPPGVGWTFSPTVQPASWSPEMIDGWKQVIDMQHPGSPTGGSTSLFHQMARITTLSAFPNGPAGASLPPEAMRTALEYMKNTGMPTSTTLGEVRMNIPQMLARIRATTETFTNSIKQGNPNRNALDEAVGLWNDLMNAGKPESIFVHGTTAMTAANKIAGSAIDAARRLGLGRDKRISAAVASYGDGIGEDSHTGERIMTIVPPVLAALSEYKKFPGYGNLSEVRTGLSNEFWGIRSAGKYKKGDDYYTTVSGHIEKAYNILGEARRLEESGVISPEQLTKVTHSFQNMLQRMSPKGRAANSVESAQLLASTNPEESERGLYLSVQSSLAKDELHRRLQLINTEVKNAKNAAKEGRTFNYAGMKERVTGHEDAIYELYQQGFIHEDDWNSLDTTLKSRSISVKDLVGSRQTRKVSSVKKRYLREMKDDEFQYKLHGKLDPDALVQRQEAFKKESEGLLLRMKEAGAPTAVVREARRELAEVAKDLSRRSEMLTSKSSRKLTKEDLAGEISSIKQETIEGRGGMDKNPDDAQAFLKLVRAQDKAKNILTGLKRDGHLLENQGLTRGDINSKIESLSSLVNSIEKTLMGETKKRMTTDAKKVTESLSGKSHGFSDKAGKAIGSGDTVSITTLIAEGRQLIESIDKGDYSFMDPSGKAKRGALKGIRGTVAKLERHQRGLVVGGQRSVLAEAEKRVLELEESLRAGVFPLEQQEGILQDLKTRRTALLDHTTMVSGETVESRNKAVKAVSSLINRVESKNPLKVFSADRVSDFNTRVNQAVIKYKETPAGQIGDPGELISLYQEGLTLRGTLVHPDNRTKLSHADLSSWMGSVDKNVGSLFKLLPDPTTRVRVGDTDRPLSSMEQVVPAGIPITPENIQALLKIKPITRKGALRGYVNSSLDRLNALEAAFPGVAQIPGVPEIHQVTQSVLRAVNAGTASDLNGVFGRELIGGINSEAESRVLNPLVSRIKELLGRPAKADKKSDRQAKAWDVLQAQGRMDATLPIVHGAVMEMGADSPDLPLIGLLLDDANRLKTAMVKALKNPSNAAMPRTRAAEIKSYQVVGRTTKSLLKVGEAQLLAPIKGLEESVKDWVGEGSKATQDDRQAYLDHIQSLRDEFMGPQANPVYTPKVKRAALQKLDRLSRKVRKATPGDGDLGDAVSEYQVRVTEATSLYNEAKGSGASSSVLSQRRQSLLDLIEEGKQKGASVRDRQYGNLGLGEGIFSDQRRNSAMKGFSAAAEEAAKSLEPVGSATDRIVEKLGGWVAPIAMATSAVASFKLALRAVYVAAEEVDGVIHRIQSQVMNAPSNMRTDLFKNIFQGAAEDSSRLGIDLSKAAEINTSFMRSTHGSLDDRRALARTAVNLDYTGVMSQEEMVGYIAPMQHAGWDAKKIRGFFERATLLQNQYQMDKHRMRAYGASFAATLPATEEMGIDDTTAEALAAFEATSTKDMVMGSKINRLQMAFRNPKTLQTMREILSRQATRSSVGGMSIEQIINNGSPMSSVMMLQEAYKQGNISTGEMTRIGQTLDMWSSPGTINELMGGIDKARKEVEVRRALVNSGLSSSDDMASEQAKAVGVEFKKLREAMSLAVGSGVQPFTNMLASLAGATAPLIKAFGMAPPVMMALVAALGSFTAALSIGAGAATLKAMASPDGGGWAAAKGVLGTVGKIGGIASLVAGVAGLGIGIYDEVVSKPAAEKEARREDWVKSQVEERVKKNTEVTSETRELVDTWSNVIDGTRTFESAKQKLVELLGAEKVAEIEKLQTLKDQTEEIQKQLKLKGEKGEPKESDVTLMKQILALQNGKFDDPVLKKTSILSVAYEMERQSNAAYNKAASNNSANSKSGIGAIKQLTDKDAAEMALGAIATQRLDDKVQEDLGFKVNKKDWGRSLMEFQKVDQAREEEKLRQQAVNTVQLVSSEKGKAGVDLTTKMKDSMQEWMWKIISPGQVTDQSESMKEWIKLAVSSNDVQKEMKGILQMMLDEIRKNKQKAIDNLTFGEKSDLPADPERILQVKERRLDSGKTVYEVTADSMTRLMESKKTPQAVKDAYKASAESAKALKENGWNEQLEAGEKAKNKLAAGKQKTPKLDTDQSYQDWLQPIMRRLSLMEAAAAGGNLVDVFKQLGAIEAMNPEARYKKTVESELGKLFAYKADSGDVGIKREEVLTQMEQIRVKSGRANVNKMIYRAIPQLFKMGYEPEIGSVGAGIMGLRGMKGEFEMSEDARQQVRGQIPGWENLRESERILLDKAEQTRMWNLQSQQTEEMLTSKEPTKMYFAGRIDLLSRAKDVIAGKTADDRKERESMRRQGFFEAYQSWASKTEKEIQDYNTEGTVTKDAKDAIQTITNGMKGELEKTRRELMKAEMAYRKDMMSLKAYGLPLEESLQATLTNTYTAAVGTDEQKQQANINLVRSQIREQERLRDLYREDQDYKEAEFATQQKILELKVQELLMTKEAAQYTRAQQAGRDFAKQLVSESVSGQVDANFNTRLGDNVLMTFRTGLQERIMRQLDDSSQNGGKNALAELGSFIFDPMGYGDKLRSEKTLNDTMADLNTKVGELITAINTWKTEEITKKEGYHQAGKLSKGKETQESTGSWGATDSKSDWGTASSDEWEPETTGEWFGNFEYGPGTSTSPFVPDTYNMDTSYSNPYNTLPYSYNEQGKTELATPAKSGEQPKGATGSKVGKGSFLDPLINNSNKFWQRGMTNGKFDAEKSGAAWTSEGNLSGWGWAAAGTQVAMGLWSGSEQGKGYGAAVRDRTKAAGTLHAASAIAATTGGPVGWTAAAAMEATALVLQMQASAKAKEEDAAKQEEAIKKDQEAQERALKIAEAQRNLLGSVAENLMALRSEVANAFKALPSSAFLSGRYAQNAPVIQVSNLTVRANNPTELSQALSQTLASQVGRGA